MSLESDMRIKTAPLNDAPCPRVSCNGDLIKENMGWRCGTCHIFVADGKNWRGIMHASLIRGVGDDSRF